MSTTLAVLPRGLELLVYLFVTSHDVLTQPLRVLNVLSTDRACVEDFFAELCITEQRFRTTLPGLLKELRTSGGGAP